MKLKTEKKIVIKVDSYDFDRFVKSIYGGEFEFVVNHEAHNYCSYEFSASNRNIDFNGEYEAKVRQGNFVGVPVSALFNILLKDGHIEKGEYLINVSW